MQKLNNTKVKRLIPPSLRRNVPAVGSNSKRTCGYTLDGEEINFLAIYRGTLHFAQRSTARAKQTEQTGRSKLRKTADRGDCRNGAKNCTAVWKLPREVLYAERLTPSTEGCRGGNYQRETRQIRPRD